MPPWFFFRAVRWLGCLGAWVPGSASCEGCGASWVCVAASCGPVRGCFGALRVETCAARRLGRTGGGCAGPCGAPAGPSTPGAGVVESCWGVWGLGDAPRFLGGTFRELWGLCRAVQDLTKIKQNFTRNLECLIKAAQHFTTTLRNFKGKSYNNFMNTL